MTRRIFKDLDAYFDGTEISQAEFAKRVGASQPAISLIRQGKRVPRPKLAKRIAEAANIPFESLYLARTESDKE